MRSGSKTKQVHPAILVLSWLPLLLGGVSLAAHAANLPAGRQAALLARVLGYANGVASRAKDKTVRVAVLYQPNDSASVDEKDELVEEMTSLFSRVRLPKGRELQASGLAFRSRKDLRKELEEGSIDVVYVVRGLDASVVDIRTVTRELSCVSVTNQESNVDNGLGIGLISRGSKPTIVVNLQATKAEGADLNPALLRVAEVVD